MTKENLRPVLGSWGVDLEGLDEAVSPAEDLYRHVNGKWLDTFDLPDDKPGYGTFNQLHEQAEGQLKNILNELLEHPPVADTPARKVRDLYASYLHQEAVDQLGYRPIQQDLATINDITSRQDLIQIFGQFRLLSGFSPISWDVQADSKYPDRQLLLVGYGSLSLPDRDFYLQTNEYFEGIRGRFLQHISEILTLTDSTNSAQSDAQAVLDIETRLAEAHWPKTDERQADKTYNPYTREELLREFCDFDWQTFFEFGLLGPFERCNVTTPCALHKIVGLIMEIPLDQWKVLLRYRLIIGAANVLADPVGDAVFQFYGTILNGQPGRLARWKRGIAFTTQGLGEQLGKLYVDKHFPPGHKEKIEKLVDNIKSAFRSKIINGSWMSNSARAAALEKLDTFVAKIGYPDCWKDYADIELNDTDLFGNFRRLARFETEEVVRRLQEPTDRKKWFMPPHMINAYYHPLMNEIVFPAAILQPPFFDPAADSAVNYGAIGAVIGHEMGHGFDDQGRKFDAQGVLREWWTSEDIDQFKNRTEPLVEQFNKYEPVADNFVNGELTLGENIGDLGGLSVAYVAYQISQCDAQAQTMDGYSGDQRFFLSFAQIWKFKARKEFAISMLKADPHSPAEYRVNGAVRNLDAWYDAFGVDDSSPLFIPDEERVQIW